MSNPIDLHPPHSALFVPESIEQPFSTSKLAVITVNGRTLTPTDVHKTLMIKELNKGEDPELRERIIKVLENPSYRLCSDSEKKAILEEVGGSSDHRRVRQSSHPVLDQENLPHRPPEVGLNSLQQPPLSLEPLEQACGNKQPAAFTGHGNKTREYLGGKGLYLTKMQEDDLPVPPFKAIGMPLLLAFEQHPIRLDTVKSCLPDFDSNGHATLCLAQIKEKVAQLPPYANEKRKNWLNGLADLIASDDFSDQIKDLPESRSIRNLYSQLRQSSPETAFIVRSSGVREDDYGDAQAGKYDSHVHGGGDILKTCLKVMASGYRPAVCPEGVPRPMAMIIQQCIECRFGGVVISHSSLQDDTIKVEYAPGQPKGAVAGQYGVTPHRYDIRTENGKACYQWLEGNIPVHFVLTKTDGGFTETEQKAEKEVGKEAAPQDQELEEAILDNLHRYIGQLEDRLACPVDVEFAIDLQGKLYLLQVRPVTQLAGGTHFSGAEPENPLTGGVLVSEGCSSGPAVTVECKMHPEDLPKGAIVYAANADDWMLEQDFLKRVGGFVFQYGGTNDHVAITLRQEGKPCLLAGDQFKKPEGSPQVTLVAGSFDGVPGAYQLAGDQTEAWQARRSSLTQDYTTALKASSEYRKRSITFKQVGQGFQWLNQQNDRLLGYFMTDRLLHLCLSPEQSKALSMSPKRTQILQQLQDEMEHLIEDAEAFVAGYDCFLQLAGDTDDQSIAGFRVELEPLKAKLATIKAQVLSQVQAITKALVSDQELSVQPINFRQWLKNCSQLKDDLQKLSQPKRPGKVSSIHDLIYFVHKQFVDATAPVAVNSGQDQVVNFTQSEASGLLNKDCLDELNNCIKKLRIKNRTVCLNLPTAFILNAQLGVHICRIEMFEQAEGNKGRKLRLVLSDNFNNDGHDQGKFKRFWFLVQSLRSMSLDKDSAGMEVHFNQAAGRVVIECSHIRTREAMQHGFLALMMVLPTLTNFDVQFDDIDIDGSGLPWGFEMLEKKCQNSDGSTDTDLTFEYCLMLIARDNTFDGPSRSDRWMRSLVDRYLNRLSDRHRLIHDTCLSIRELIDTQYPEEIQAHNPEEIQAHIDKMKNLPDLDEGLRRELLLQLMVAFPNVVAPRLLCIDEFNQCVDVNTAIRLCRQNGALFPYLSLELRNNRDVFLEAIKTSEHVLGNAGEDIKNSKDLVFSAVKIFPVALKDAGDFQDNEELVMAAVTKDPRAYGYASERLKNDIKVLMPVVKRGYYGVIHITKHIGNSIRNNAEVMLKIIEVDPASYKSIGDSLKGDKDFILKVIKLTPEVISVVNEELKQDRQVLQLVGNILSTEEKESILPHQFISMLRRNPYIFPYLRQELKDNPNIRIAVGKPLNDK